MLKTFALTKSFVARLGGVPYSFVAPSDLQRVSVYELYVDTPQGQQRIARSAKGLGAECHLIDPAKNTAWNLPVCLNGQREHSTLLPRDEALLARLRQRCRPGQPLRLALLNAFGTGLGDNLVGMQAFRLILPLLQAVHPLLEIDVIRSWSGAKPEYVLQGEPWIGRFRTTPLRLDEWLNYDACYDFSGLVSLPGFKEVPWPDFHLLNLGVAPERIAPELKRAAYAVRYSPDFARGAEFVAAEPAAKQRRVLLHATASTPLRTIAPAALAALLTFLAQQPVQLITDDAAVMTAAAAASCPCRLLRDKSLDELCGALSAVDLVITCNSFLLHAANLTARPVIAFFIGLGRYEQQMLPWQDNILAIEVDPEQRYADRFKMSAAELQKNEEKEYFAACWQAAVALAEQKITRWLGEKQNESE
ncbi:hypothetical protein [Desulfuromonas thiophila]|uniref:ADP-heptose:LPS heptosyltransferase n=1 Tax=Desulfuromonas thiophila TaxID=57664 RepID=A0A1G7BUZ3_9BACT|nr:hypothetical protein [Desulfuromonas thiophila]SDE30817.1 hypothetical protein SAMN05661003_10756 [Desulfuromonas thiophila]